MLFDIIVIIVIIVIVIVIVVIIVVVIIIIIIIIMQSSIIDSIDYPGFCCHGRGNIVERHLDILVLNLRNSKRGKSTYTQKLEDFASRILTATDSQ